MNRKSWRKRLVFWLPLAALALPIAGFGLSNLFLISPKGRTFIASRIAARIGMETSVQGTSWSPWNGITVYGLRIEQPMELRDAISRPLLTVQSIHLDPVWKQLVRKRLDLKGIDIVKPDFTLPIELLAMIPSEPAETVPAVDTPPALAMNPPPQPVIPAPGGPMVMPVPAAPQPAPPQPQAETPKILPAPPEITTPTQFVGLTDARVRIVTAMSKSTLYEVTSLNGKIPFGGKKTQTTLIAGSISALGSRITEDMKIPLAWSAPALTSSPIDGKLFGIDATSGVQLGLTQGLPLRIVAAIPEQKHKEICVGETTGMKLGAIGGQGIFQGYLSHPLTWQGQALVRSIAIDAAHHGNESHFDSGHALFIFRNGALSCVDARLNGEQTSILGNATLLSDGRGAANLRIVASPEILRAVSSFTDPTGSPPYYTPLHTPQRAALDLQVLGRLGDFRYKPNPKAAAIQIR
ncbi:MAG: hypothetical protein ABJQ29_05935 [Luteolibacter sp.]